jgi:hypothetical protein
VVLRIQIGPLFYIDGGIPQGGLVHFRVVDVDAWKEVSMHEQKMMFNNSEAGSFHVAQFTPPKIALSPDGHTAAILSDGFSGLILSLNR